MKEAIHALKYDGLYAAAPRLGAMLATAISTLVAEAPLEMLVVPVPLHKSKHAQRGFNQARVLATHALKSLAENASGVAPYARRQQSRPLARYRKSGRINASHAPHECARSF